MMIREVRSEDVARVMELLQQLWPGKPIDDRRMREVVEKYVADQGYEIYGYEEKGTLVGIITASYRWALFYEGQVAIIEDLVVNESHRGKGIGSRLVQSFEDRVCSNKLVRAIELSSDSGRQEAHAFWERHGYSKLAFQFRKRL
jgi:PhnO protein